MKSKLRPSRGYNFIIIIDYLIQIKRKKRLHLTSKIQNFFSSHSITCGQLQKITSHFLSYIGTQHTCKNLGLALFLQCLNHDHCFELLIIHLLGWFASWAFKISNSATESAVVFALFCLCFTNPPLNWFKNNNKQKLVW